MRSPFYEELQASGAAWADHFGHDVAEHFGSPEEEYRRACESAVLMDMHYLGRIWVRGRDRSRYLHNMLSNDIKGLAPGRGCHAALLTHQGKMESDLYVFALADYICLELPAAGKNRALSSLAKYIVADDVAIEDRSAETALLSVQGPRANALLRAALDSAIDEMEPLSHRVVEVRGSKWMVVRRDRTGYGGYDLWLPEAEAAAAWRELAGKWGARPAGFRVLNQLRTEAGIPWYGPDMDEKTLPMEVGLYSAISLTKGCYRGQEIMARVHYRGNLDRSLGGIALSGDTIPVGGAEVTSGGAKVGEVTSAAYSPRLGHPLALAIMKKSCLEAGTAVDVRTGGSETCAGRVVGLPLM